MRRTVGWRVLVCGFLVWVGNGHAYGSGPVVINLQSPEFAPERTAAVEKAFPGAHVHSFQMLDDQIALLFVETWPERSSGLYLVNLATKEVSPPIAGLGVIENSGRDLSGNVWSIVKQETDVPGYIDHGYAAFTVRMEAAHRYRVDRMWLPDYADEYESEANLCLYFKTHEHVNLEATLSVQQRADKSTTLTFKLLKMECPSGSKTSQTASFLPLESGFASLDLPSTIYQVSTLIFPGS